MLQTWWPGHGAQSVVMPGRPCQMLSAGQCEAFETGSAPQVWWSGPLPLELHLDREPCEKKQANSVSFVFAALCQPCKMLHVALLERACRLS